MRLYEHRDLLAVGRMADLVRERLHGDAVFYNINRHIEPTNVCATECAFCAFGKKASDPGAYEMGLEEVYERAAALRRRGRDRGPHRRGAPSRSSTCPGTRRCSAG